MSTPSSRMLVENPDISRALFANFESADDADMERIAQELSWAASLIPESALASQVAWEEWRAEYLDSPQISNQSFGWIEAGKCATGILTAAVTAFPAVGGFKKLLTAMRNVKKKMAEVINHAGKLYHAYRNGKNAQKRAKALQWTLADAFTKDFAAADIAAELLDFFTGLSAGTVAACAATMNI